jgi:hypothetical protein
MLLAITTVSACAGDENAPPIRTDDDRAPPAVDDDEPREERCTIDRGITMCLGDDGLWSVAGLERCDADARASEPPIPRGRLAGEHPVFEDGTVYRVVASEPGVWTLRAIAFDDPRFAHEAQLLTRVEYPEPSEAPSFLPKPGSTLTLSHDTTWSSEWMVFSDDVGVVLAWGGSPVGLERGKPFSSCTWPSESTCPAWHVRHTVVIDGVAHTTPFAGIVPIDGFRTKLVVLLGTYDALCAADGSGMLDESFRVRLVDRVGLD